MKGKFLNAQYVEEAKSVLFLIESKVGKFRGQWHRDEIATFGDRTEEEITKAMYNYVDTLNEIYRDLEIDIGSDGSVQQVY